MYVRLITFHLKPRATKAEATAVYHALHRELHDYPGFRGMTALINEEERRAVSLSYWEDQENANYVGEKFMPILMDTVHDLVDRPPEVTGYEVIRQEFYIE